MTDPASGQAPEPGHTHCKTSPSSNQDSSPIACQVHNTFWLVAIHIHVGIKGVIAAAEQLLSTCACKRKGYDRAGTDSCAVKVAYLRLSQAMISTEAAFSCKHLPSEIDPTV